MRYFYLLCFSIATFTLQAQHWPLYLDIKETFTTHEELHKITVTTTNADQSTHTNIYMIDRDKRVVSNYSLEEDGQHLLRTTEHYDHQWRILSRKRHNDPDYLISYENYLYNDEEYIVEKWTQSQRLNRQDPSQVRTDSSHTIYYYDEDCNLLRNTASGVSLGEAFDKEIQYTRDYDSEGRKTEEIASSKEAGEDTFRPRSVQRWNYRGEKVIHTYRFGLKGRKVQQIKWYDNDGQLIKRKWRGPHAKSLSTFTYENGLRTSMYMLSSNPLKKEETRISYSYE